MLIETEFHISLDEKDLIKYQGKRFERLLNRPGISISFHLMKDKIQQIARPILGWDRFKVKGIDHDRFVLDNGVKIGGGKMVEIMKESSELLVGVCTLGILVDQEIDSLQKSKEMMNAVLLDSLANWMVDQVRSSFIDRFKRDIESEELFYSTSMGPGEVWDISDQRTIFKLLDDVKIKENLGLELRESMLMVPMKSVSFVMGLAKDPFGMKNVSKCDFCLNKKKCRHPEAMRHENVAVAPDS